jgi:hypothetical protein
VKVGDLVTLHHTPVEEQHRYVALVLAVTARMAIVRWIKHPIFCLKGQSVETQERGEQLKNLRLLSEKSE